MNTKKLIMTIAAAAAVAAGTPASAVQVRHTATVEGIKSYELDNGLQVLLFPDQSKPTVTVNTTYLVGSRMENYGETGMAHLLEHLMFKGSRNYPNPTKDFSDRGFTMNGSTWLDRTNYFVSFVPVKDNLRYAIGWSADAMVNSFIARKDLDTEMTVVRNEYEKGENSPFSVIMKRMQSVLFDWHSYGRSTIGARSDIENVPIENLQAFYRRWYQPDNAVFTIAGKFDEEEALAIIKETFGAIPRPERALPKEWTVEPVSDGPREFEVRRQGEVQIAAVGYRTPAALSADSNALETAIDILTDAPRGRLYKALVETGKASSVSGWAMGSKDPGFAIFTASAGKDRDIREVRDILVKTIEETFREKPAGEDEVAVFLAEAATDYERSLSNPENFGIEISEYIALGDWRSFFIDRDSTARVKPADVDRAAQAYFVRDNRVVGLFVPDAEPKRAPAMEKPDVAALVSSASFREEGDSAEAFEATQENINARTEVLEINGVKVALLPKKTRGRTVTVNTVFEFGNLEVMQDTAALDMVFGPMMTRGTTSMSRTEIADAMTALKMEGDIFSFSTDRDSLAGALELLGAATADSTFPEREAKQLLSQLITRVESRSDDPRTLGRDAMSRHFATYPEGDPRNRASTADILRDLRRLDRERLFARYRGVYSTEHGQIAIIGDFDAEEAKRVLARVLGRKKAADPKAAWKRWWAEYRPVAPARFVIDSPEKENAAIFLRFDFPASINDDDAAALKVANEILGGGTGLSNRLVTRLRQKEGLSYGAGSSVRLPDFGNRASFNAAAIVAPQNLASAEFCFREELERAVRDGFTETEVEEAKTGLLQSRQLARAQDENLAYSWTSYLAAGKDFSFSAGLERRIAALTADDVNRALRRMVKPDEITYVLVGDRAKAEAAGKSFDKPL